MIRKLDYIIKNLDFKKKIFFSVLIVLSFMIIGYATYSTSLLATGGTEITQDYENFKVIIDKVVYDGYINEINNDNVSFSFTTNLSDDLTESDVYVELFNDSEQYDVNATLLCDAVSDSTYSITLDKSQFRLNAKTKDVVNIKLNKLGEFTNKTINCQFTIEGLEKNELSGNYTEEAPSSNEIFVERNNDSDNKTLKEELDELRRMAKNRGIDHTGEEFTFDYTGSSQTFNVPYDGNYKVELWGAQGGTVNSTYNGGYGGYSVGKIDLSEGEILYVTVGGQGERCTINAICAGGFNGGGNSVAWNEEGSLGGSGGGATSITDTLIENGELYHYVDNKDNVIIVAGGGGGSAYTNAVNYGYGGHGGGYEGATSVSTAQDSYINGYGSGGTQTSGGSSVNNGVITGNKSGSFGKGYSSVIPGDAAGGGGGYYGGGTGSHSGAGGGSGYIGNTSLINKHMTCHNCATSDGENTKTISNTCVNSTATSDCSKSGNGYVKITYLGNN